MVGSLLDISTLKPNPFFDHEACRVFWKRKEKHYYLIVSCGSIFLGISSHLLESVEILRVAKPHLIATTKHVRHLSILLSKSKLLLHASCQVLHIIVIIKFILHMGLIGVILFIPLQPIYETTSSYVHFQPYVKETFCQRKEKEKLDFSLERNFRSK